jgi:hypothetical protein
MRPMRGALPVNRHRNSGYLRADAQLGFSQSAKQRLRKPMRCRRASKEPIEKL